MRFQNGCKSRVWSQTKNAWQEVQLPLLVSRFLRKLILSVYKKSLQYFIGKTHASKLVYYFNWLAQEAINYYKLWTANNNNNNNSNNNNNTNNKIWSDKSFDISSFKGDRLLKVPIMDKGTPLWTMGSQVQQNKQIIYKILYRQKIFQQLPGMQCGPNPSVLGWWEIGHWSKEIIFENQYGSLF